MFQLKNSDPGGKGSKNAPEFNVEEIPVITMKKDLEQIEKTGTLSIESSSEKPAGQKPMPQSLSSSPFFNQDIRSSAAPKTEHPSPTIENENRPEARPGAFAISPSVQSANNPPTVTPSAFASKGIGEIKPGTETLTIKESTGETKPTWKRLIFIAISLFIILAAGVGGYYFWITRSAQPVADVTPVNPPAAEAPRVATLDLSEINPNYINIDPAAADSVTLRQTFQKYGEATVKKDATGPIEGIIRDMANNPVPFRVFAQKSNLVFSETLLANLGEDYSVYFTNDSGIAHMGLAINTANDTTLKNALTSEESNLPTDLKPLFLTDNYTLVPKQFSSSSYGGADIRYRNITDKEDLSVDYTVFNHQLLIGTSKNTLRLIIDSLVEKTTENNTPNNNNPLPASIQE